MSVTETVDDLAKLELSRFEDMAATSLKKPDAPVIEHPFPQQPKVAPMGAQSEVVLSAPDRLLFRLNKLLLPTKDLGSVLTTFNYGLYLLAYFDAKAHKVKSKALSLVTTEAAISALSSIAEAESSPFARLGSVVANARTTLRLFGLLPIYVRARRLMNDSKGMDHFLYVIAVLQCSLFATFQFLENVAFLTDNGVLAKRGLGRWAGGAGGSVATIYRVAHRAWFLGIMCDFARLMREAQIFFRRNHIDKGEITKEEAEKAAQWYYDWVRPLAWLPIGWQLSAWTQDGVAGLNNLGVQGIAGVLADLGRTATLWHATKEA
ncbi:hypothetical protein BJ170DRAFT_594174 [Xylariales sp. AK1849]|nr:hypothetical protein BJ170DRAFT_594174 [Xylariales sp. AK1849]